MTRYTKLLPITVALLLGPLAAGCTRSTSVSGAPPSTTAPAAPSTTAATSVSTLVPPDQLHHVTPSAATDAVAAKLIDQIPGFKLQPDNVGDTGPSDLAKAADDDGSTNARQTLTQAGFVAGYQRLFTNDSGDTMFALALYEFSSSTGAADYASSTITQMKANPPDDSQSTTGPEPIKGIPQSAEFSAKDGKGNTAWFEIFSKGKYFVSVQVSTSDNAAQPSPSAAEVAAEQAKRL